MRLVSLALLALAGCGTSGLFGTWTGSCTVQRFGQAMEIPLSLKVDASQPGGPLGGSGPWVLYTGYATATVAGSPRSYRGMVTSCEGEGGCSVDCTGVEGCAGDGSHPDGYAETVVKWEMDATTPLQLMGDVADGVWQGRCWYTDEGIASAGTFRVER